MRGKRSKQYRKLMQQYALAFGFREPYQVILDAGMLEDAVARFKMDFVNILSRTLHGEVKPMVTQCTIRHLYSLPAGSSASEPGSDKPSLSQADKTAILDVARTCEKRRCGHHELEQPLSTLECLKSVIDPKENSTNRHRYVLACQDEAVRSWARTVRGVPSIYVKRSVMVMEPMAGVSIDVKHSAEREKLRSGIKRKRGEPRSEFTKTIDGDATEKGSEGTLLEGGEAAQVKKQKKPKGPKGPNPLSVKKPKARAGQDSSGQTKSTDVDGDGSGTRKRRKRRHGKADEGEEGGGVSLAEVD